MALGAKFAIYDGLVGPASISGTTSSKLEVVQLCTVLYNCPLPSVTQMVVDNFCNIIDGKVLTMEACIASTHDDHDPVQRAEIARCPEWRRRVMVKSLDL